MKLSIYYSHNDEDFYELDPYECATRLWEDSNNIEVGDIVTIHEGHFNKCCASEFMPDPSGDMLDRASDEIGEYANDWDFTADQAKELTAAVAKTIDEWCAENKCEPTFMRLIESKPIRMKFTSDDGTSEIVCD